VGNVDGSHPHAGRQQFMREGVHFESRYVLVVQYTPPLRRRSRRWQNSIARRKVHTDRMVAASTQMLLDAKKEAEALLTEGGVWAEMRIKAAGASAAAIILADLRQETTKAERAYRAAVRVAWVMALVGLVILSGLGGVALAAICPL
jgi:hypothetical protein